MTRDSSPKDLLPHLQDLLKLARGAGASGVELLHTRIVERRMTSSGASASPIEAQEEDVLNGRLFVETGASATFSINANLKGRHPASIEKAIARAKKSSPNPGAGPYERMDINQRGLGLHDPRYATIGQEALDELVEINQSGLETPHSLSYTDRFMNRFFISSTGYHASSTSTFYKLRLQNQVAKWGLPMEELACGRAFSHVGSIPFGRLLDSRIQGLSETGNAPSGPLPLVLPTRVVAWLLNELAPIFAVREAESKHRFLRKLPGGVLGTRILHVVDDPVAPGGVRTRPFDDRGIAPIAVPVIREGVVGNYFLDPKTARSRDIRPTGHFWNGKIRASNLVLRPGNRSRTQMLTEVPLSLELDHLNGQLDLKTGHLDAWGPALILDKGKPVGAVKKIHLNFPISELFSAFKEVASNQLRSHAVDSATVLTLPLDVTTSA